MGNLNKTVIIIFIILILGGVIGIFILLNNPNSTSSQNTKSIQTSNGPLNVKDYTQNPVQSTEDAIVIEKTDTYEILNYKIDNSFLVSLLAQPLGQTRISAQNALLKDLNITEQQACTLNVSVTTPKEVDAKYSGMELGISFCQNSTTLP